MYVYGLLCTLLIATAHATEHYCYEDLAGPCGTSDTNQGGHEMKLPNCHAKYGNIGHLQSRLQSYANAQIEKSFEFLLMSTHFGNYESNREGLKALFRKMSDQAWSDGIDVIKYITKRGGEMDFNQGSHLTEIDRAYTVENDELHTLARALDSQKQLASEAMHLHTAALQTEKHDAPAAHYIEEKFFESQTEIIRNLAGYTNDLRRLVSDGSATALSVFEFDEYLKKIV